MRKFNEREKRVIERLVEGASRSFTYLAINAYDDIFYRKQVEFVYQPTSELIFYFQSGNQRSTDDIFRVTSEIYEISYLIDYLEKEGMIRHFSVGVGEFANNIAGFDKAGLIPVSVSIDQLVGQMLYNNLNYPIYITQALVSLVQANFRTLEEQTFDEAKQQTKEAKKQSILSIIAVILALLTLFFSFMKGVKGCTNSSVHNEGSFNEGILPITKILNYMKNNIENKIDATMNNTADICVMMQDTLNIKVSSCPCRKARIPSRPQDKCIKTIRINTCEDTVVSRNGME